MHMRHLIIVATSVLLMGNSSAVAQNALGGGHALDANPSATGGRFNQAKAGRFNLGPAQPRSFTQSFSPATNAQFRQHNIDNVGQRLVTESLNNNPWYWQNAGSLFTEMLTAGSGAASSFAAQQQGQYNPFFYDQWETPGGRMRLAAGQRLSGLASPLDATPAEPRPGSTGNVLQVPTGGSTFLQDDHLGTMVRAGRETWRGEQAQRLAGEGMASDKTPVRYLISPLRGMTQIPQQASPQDIGLNDWDTSRMFADRMSSRPMAAPGRAWNARFASLRMDPGRLDSQQMTTSAPGLMRPVMQAVADRYKTLRPAEGSTEAALADLDRQYSRMRSAVIRGGDAPLSELLAQFDQEIEDATAGQRDATGATDETSDEADEASGQIEPGTVSGLTPAEFNLILKHGQRVATLSSGDRTRFDDLVAAGEKALREGEYLYADRRFSRALRFIPGQPLATAGLVSAQVGGGLYLSAALTLKSLLGFQPEMIDVRFDAQLLPKAADLDRAISILTGRLSEGQDLDRYGLILAWIGHQIDREQLVTAGLDAMLKSGRDVHFTNRLEQIWSDERLPEPTDGRTRLEPVSDSTP
ncbi:MAG: hypothetical protein MK101_11180 [Phycisphaerales bacterium]|nr:hypothetical protein [Phycisphaerales bacterium]